MDGERAQADEQRAAPASAGAAELDAARFGFHAAFPQHSAKHRLHLAQLACFALLAGLLGLALYATPGATLEALHAAAFVFFAAAILIRLAAAGQLHAVMSRLAEPKHWPTYTILCPLYREANVAPDLIAALTRLDYPLHALDVKILAESDDAATLAALADAPPHIEIVVIPACAPRTKPKALNIGLARARGEYVVVYDAEDRPHPQQLRAALAAFEDGDAKLACVQAPLAVDNAHASWIAGQFAAEYAIQFREVLPLLARLKLPLPLGGTSNHFRTSVLREIGGWDPFNVTEDCENFRQNFRSLSSAPLRVPIKSHSEKLPTKGLIGKEKPRDMFNVTGFTRTFPKQTHTFARARIFESRSCPKSVGNGKKCVIGRHREAHRAA